MAVISNKELFLEFKKVCVLGLGYIGLPTASTLATHGLRVVGVDVNAEVVKTLRNGGVHIQEPGLRELVERAITSGNLTVSEQPEPADAFIIAVPTPFKEEKRADLSYVVSATESIVPHLRPGSLVILESTSPPRTTTDIVQPILESSGLRAGDDFHLAYSPERVLPGKIVQELIENDRVVGGVTPASSQAAHDLYALFVKGEIILSDATTAEMVKLMENTTRDVNIALANEFSRLADRVGIDVWEAIALANRHPRINILRPGPGVGGHCIGVDPWFLVEAAPDITPLIRASREVNDAQPAFVLDLVKRAVGELSGKRAAVLGLTFKENVDDLRESPAIAIAHLLKDAGAAVTAHEPYHREKTQIENIPNAPTLEAALADAEVILLLVKHNAFTGLTPQEVAALTPARVVVDAVNAWPPETWEAEGFRVFRLGVGSKKKMK